MSFKKLALVAAIITLSATGLAAQAILTGSTQTPFKMARTPGGNFVLAETGTGKSDGKVTLLSLWGTRLNLLSGLPSGVGPLGEASGPTAVADAHTTLYIVIGEGDVMGPTVAGQQAPNPNGLTSPLFSSVIRARFTPVPDGIRTGFQLTAADLETLADGKEVALQNNSGERVELLLLADFRDVAPDPRIRVRNANPFAATIAGTLTAEDLREFGLEGESLSVANFQARLNPTTPAGRRLEERSRIYVVDAGMNTVTEVVASTGRFKVITRFPAISNSLFPTVGGPVTDPVPTGIYLRGDGTLLVSTLGGFPFATGSAKIHSVNPATGAFTPFIEGLTSATNVIEVAGAIYVLEISSNLRTRLPGRLLRFASATSTPTVIAEGLIGATGLAYEPTRNELLVSETFTGLIKRIPLAP